MTQVRGFSKAKDDTTWLLKHGLPEKAIYQDGRGAETLEECLASFRGCFWGFRSGYQHGLLAPWDVRYTIRNDISMKGCDKHPVMVGRVMTLTCIFGIAPISEEK